MSHPETAAVVAGPDSAPVEDTARAPSATPLSSGLYVGHVRHRRFEPVNNEFTYSGFWLYLDLAELDEVFRGRWLWSTRRPALMRFCREDHLLFPEDVPGADQSLDLESVPSDPVSFGKKPQRPKSSRRNPINLPPLDDSVRSLVEASTGRRPSGPIRLLTQVRCFGYIMNPVCFYYCFNEADSRVETVVAEVNNTP